MEKNNDERDRKEKEFEARMAAMRAEQAKRTQQGQQFTCKQEQTEVPGIGTVHSGSIDFGDGISLEDFKKLFQQPVKDNPQQKTEKKIPADPAQKEKEFEARMAAMREEQAKRAQQHNTAPKSNVIVPGTVFMTDHNQEEFNEAQRQKGFHVYPEPDGIVFFCKPGYGHEEHRAKYLADYRAMRKARGK